MCLLQQYSTGPSDTSMRRIRSNNAIAFWVFKIKLCSSQGNHMYRCDVCWQACSGITGRLIFHVQCSSCQKDDKCVDCKSAEAWLARCNSHDKDSSFYKPYQPAWGNQARKSSNTMLFVCWPSRAQSMSRLRFWWERNRYKLQSANLGVYMALNWTKSVAQWAARQQ